MTNRAKTTNRANVVQFLIGSLANQAYFFRQQFNNHDFIMFLVAFLLWFLKNMPLLLLTRWTCHTIRLVVI